VRGDSKTFTFITYKASNLHGKKRNPRVIAWTTVYRKAHKKDASSKMAKKKRTRRNVKAQKAIVGASLEAIRAKRSQKPEARKKERELALKEIKERKRAAAAARKKGQKTGGKPHSKNFAPKYHKGKGR